MRGCRGNHRSTASLTLGHLVSWWGLGLLEIIRGELSVAFYGEAEGAAGVVEDAEFLVATDVDAVSGCDVEGSITLLITLTQISETEHLLVLLGEHLFRFLARNLNS